MQTTGQPDAVWQLLIECRHAIEASDAHKALQYVVQALQLLRGDNAVLPTLRAAAEQYHAQQAAPIHELSQLLAQVSIAAEQDMAGQQQDLQQQQQQNLQQQQQQQQQWPHQPMQWQATPATMSTQPRPPLPQQQHDLGQGQEQRIDYQNQQQQQQQQQHLPHRQHLQSQHHHHHQQQQQQQQQQCGRLSGSSQPILEETGRGSFSEAALSDGSSWQCPHCSGVVPIQRQQAHLAYWCPYLQHNSC